MDWYTLAGPMLAAALGGVLSVLVIDAMRGKPGRKVKDVTILSYGPVARFVALASLCFPVLCLLGAWKTDSLIWTCVFVFLFAIAAYFSVLSSYLALFTRMAFDEVGIYYHSPLRGGRAIAWDAVVRIGYSDVVQTHYFKACNGEMFWMSRCMNGFDEFLACARRSNVGFGPSAS